MIKQTPLPLGEAAFFCLEVSSILTRGHADLFRPSFAARFA
jgi:hypothetical protein